MKLTICILLLLSISLSAHAPVAPVAIAKFCGQVGGKVVRRKEMKLEVERLGAEGCLPENIVVTDLPDGYAHVYGTKVYIGE